MFRLYLLLFVMSSTYASESGMKYLIEQNRKNAFQQLLLKNDLNEIDSDGQTLLHFAIKNRKMDIAILLIDKGIDVNIKDKCGHTALHLASIRGEIPLLQMLIKHGADINVKNVNGWTPIHWAAWFKNEINFEFLLENGADLSIATKRDKDFSYWSEKTAAQLFFERAEFK